MIELVRFENEKIVAKITKSILRARYSQRTEYNVYWKTHDIHSDWVCCLNTNRRRSAYRHLHKIANASNVLTFTNNNKPIKSVEQTTI